MEKLINKQTAELFKKHASSEIQKMIGKKFAATKIPIVDYCNTNGDLVRLVAAGHHDFIEFRANCWDQYHINLEMEKINHQYHKECFVTTEDRKGGIGEPGYKGSTFSTTEPCDAYSRGAEPVTVGKP